jgi:G8 domain
MRNIYRPGFKLFTLIFTGLVALTGCNQNTSIVPVPITPVGAGTNWSDPATWGGKLPDSNSSVTIPQGKTVVLDANVDVRNITVYGALTVANKDLELSAGHIMVHGPGVFQVSQNGGAFTKRLTITLKGADASENIMGMGTKFLGAMMGGKLEIIGEDRVSWSQLGVSAAQGASTITLKENVDWRVGEKIVLTSSSMNPEEAEERTITAVAGANVTLDKPLSFAHFGQLQTFDGKTLDERSEVGLLSRNIVIQGDDASTSSQFGGHVMVMGASTSTRETNPANRSSAKIRGVEFRRMGQFNHVGRYPIHWHQNGDSSNDFLENSSIHDSLQRGVVIHGSDSVRLENNLVFKTPGHAFALEDGSEKGNTLTRNLAILPRPATFTVDGLKDQQDKAAAGFWLRTAAVTVTGNVSAGGNYAGFWFDLSFLDGANATKTNLKFDANTVHSHLGERVPNTESDTWAVWHTDGFVPSQDGVLNFTRVTAYKNARAIETLGRGVTTDSMLADNGKAISQITLRDSVVVSRSANLDSSSEWGEAGMFAYGGFANAERVTWINFKDGRTVARTLTCGIEYPRFSATGSKMIDSDPQAGCGDSINRDIDGSMSGSSTPKTLVSYNPNSSDNSFGLVSQECEKRAALGLAICPNFDYRTLGVTYPTDPGFSNANWRIDIVRDEDNNRVTPLHYRWVSYVTPGKTYRLEVKNIINTGDMNVYALEKLAYVNLGLSVGDLSEAPQAGGKSAVYDPTWATRSLTVSAPAPSVSFKIRFCQRGDSCDNDPAKWSQINAATNLSALQAGSSSGFVIDAGRIYFRFFGGDQLRFEP